MPLNFANNIRCLLYVASLPHLKRPRFDSESISPWYHTPAKSKLRKRSIRSLLMSTYRSVAISVTTCNMSYDWLVKNLCVCCRSFTTRSGTVQDAARSPAATAARTFRSFPSPSDLPHICDETAPGVRSLATPKIPTVSNKHKSILV